ncbi:MAG: hypothetical protein E7K36_13895, partial [Bacteroides sp.]|nr:hypothetical protein [Bacteroides sp.]
MKTLVLFKYSVLFLCLCGVHLNGFAQSTREKVCQNAHLLFLCTKPRLSQAGALLLPKDFVSL